MPQPKFQLYKHCKIDGQWRYCRAAVFSNNKIKPHVVIVGGQEKNHEEGSYCIRHKNAWIDAGTDPLEAQRLRSKLLDQVEYKDEKPAGAVRGTPLKDAAEKYFTNLENRGIKANSIRTYRNAVDPFIAQCMKTKTCVEEVTKQDLLDFMGWMRKQPLPKRKHSNPERTYANKVGHVAIFLKEFKVGHRTEKERVSPVRREKGRCPPRRGTSVAL